VGTRRNAFLERKEVFLGGPGGEVVVNRDAALMGRERAEVTELRVLVKKKKRMFRAGDLSP